MSNLLGTLNTTEKPMASMHEVVMKKEELLKVLVENKAKHDVVYEAAVAGYWDAAKDKIEEKKKQLTEAIANLQEDANTSFRRFEKKVTNKETLPYSIETRGLQWNTNLGLVFPDNHTKDYDRAIRMMGASIYNEVRLSEQEFDSYVLNNWEWKEKFIASNSYYVDNFRNKGLTLVTGCMGATGPQGSAGYAGYAGARTLAISNLTASGCASF